MAKALGEVRNGRTSPRAVGSILDSRPPGGVPRLPRSSVCFRRSRLLGALLSAGQGSRSGCSGLPERVLT